MIGLYIDICRWVFICMHLALSIWVFISMYWYVPLYISLSNLEAAQEYSGEEIMIRFIKRRFPGCLSDLRQVSIWHGFQFSQPQQFQYPYHGSTWRHLFVRILLVGFLKCLGLSYYAYKMLMGSVLKIEKVQETRSPIIFFLFSFTTSIFYLKDSTLTSLGPCIPWAKHQTPSLL